ncbi:hypothetical protein [Paenibacillus whitsoniae]|uniref:Uncharacterized protein n=1 Tax=Paenibacillus whitsoniae TaxID=2496558 RepID=A0A430JC91_9BACL|nr:hypothetical protein [Paenibacillus whitsoniae]RTE08640.1 hypothetical protein EJQ19_16265 [Paenibacillus whitsoniae]
MSGIIEILLKVAPLITVVLVLIRFNITTTNKTLIDLLLTPKNNRDWDDFLEIISVSLILILTLNVSSLIVDYSKLSSTFKISLISIDGILFLISAFFLLVSWLLLLFRPQINIKLINFVFFTNFTSLLLFSFFNTALNQKYLISFYSGKQYSKLLIILGLFYVFYILIFYFYRLLYKAFNKPRVPAYKIEKIPVNQVEELLKELFFIYLLDSERHILSKFPVDRKKITLPVYVYYPKDNSLVEFKKD